MAISKVLHEALSFVPQGYLFGLTMSTAGASTTLTVGAGSACDSTGLRIMKLVASMAKTTSAWAAGTAAGGLDTGAIANSTWYHWFLIMNPTTGAVDVVYSATATPAAGPTTLPSGFTLFRRIGAAKTNGSAQWTKFLQEGDYFQWDVPVLDVNVVNPGTAAVTRAITTPLNLRVLADMFVLGVGASPADMPGSILISDLSITDTAPTNTAGGSIEIFVSTGTGVTNLGGGSRVSAWTNTSSQVRTRLQISAAGTTLDLMTHGWTDFRGKLS